jgi:hypothetical protein
MTPLYANVPVDHVVVDAAPAVAERPPASDSGSSFKLGAGAYYGKFFSIPTYGAELSLALGGRWRDEFGYIGVHVEIGRTREGLQTWGFHPNAMIEFASGPVRYGLEGRVGFMEIHRVTYDESLVGASIGAGVHVAVDLVSGRSGAAYLQATAAADDYFDPIALSAALNLGYRWDNASRL